MTNDGLQLQLVYTTTVFKMLVGIKIWKVCQNWTLKSLEEKKRCRTPISLLSWWVMYNFMGYVNAGITVKYIDIYCFVNPCGDSLLQGIENVYILLLTWNWNLKIYPFAICRRY